MQFDLGIQALAILLVLAIGFGVVVHVVAGRATPWIGPISGVGYFIGGLFVSEVMFAGATEKDLQPVIDGLAFDESLLGGIVVGLVAAVITWYMARSSTSRPLTR